MKIKSKGPRVKKKPITPASRRDILPDAPARYQAYVQAIPDIIYEIDAKGRFIFVSNSIRQLGYQPKDLTGKHFKSIVYPGDMGAVSRFIILPRYKGKRTGQEGAPKLFDERRTGARITKHLEVRLLPQGRRASFGFFFGEIHSLGVWDKGVKQEHKSLLGSIGIIRDITSRKETEERLKKAHQMLRDILEKSPLGIYVANVKGGIDYVNPSMVNISGCTYAQFKGLNVFKEPAHTTSGLSERLRFALEGAVFFLGPLEHTWCGSNKSIVANFTGIPLDEDGDKKVIVFVEDISELKRTQLELIQAKKMEVVGCLASGVAHEVKNPLATIVYGVGYLRKRIKPEDENVVLTLRHIEEAVRRADNIIRDLLDFSSLSRLHITREDLNRAINKSLSLTKHQLDKQHIGVVRELREDLPFVEIDVNRIEQALVNVILNALEAMPKGGRLTVRTTTRKLTRLEEGIGFRKEDVFKLGETVVIVEIEDSGPGIAEDNLDKIFDPFFTTKRALGGTGLGLSIVRNIVKSHSGRIEIKNIKNKGVRVTLMFKV
ncbi:PAS domain S-box protein [Candidatus Omnitrophota bacterium]